MTFRDNVLICNNCGDTHEIELPVGMDEFGKEIRAFMKRHIDCKPKADIGRRHLYAGNFGGC